MLKKCLILIGRTFIATFLLVNFFNIIPINYQNNAWFVQISMLLVDTCSLLLLGLLSLKLVSFLSINPEVISGNNDTSQNQKYERNIKVINKFSGYFMYLFVFIAILQFFVVPNGLSQLDMIYSERALIFEKQHQINQKKLESESKINLENNNYKNNSQLPNLFQKDRVFQALTMEKNNNEFSLGIWIF